MDTKNERTSTVSVVEFKERSRADALERLNRITGLQFDSLPESLIDDVAGQSSTRDDGEELVFRALSLWASQQNDQK